MFISRRNWRVSMRSSDSATIICPLGAGAFCAMTGSTSILTHADAPRAVQQPTLLR